MEEQFLIWTRNYAISKEEMAPLKCEDRPYEYSAVFHLEALGNKR